MLKTLAGNDFLIVTVLVFVAIMLALESLYLMWRAQKGPEARKFHNRLRVLTAVRDITPETQLLKQRLLSDLPPLERRLQSLPRVRGLDRFLLQSDVGWSVSRLILTCIAAAAGGWVVAVSVAHQSQLVGAVAAAVLGVIPIWYVSLKREKRLKKIEAQLPDALDLITRALRAGHAFSSGLKMAGEEMAEPIAAELRIVHDEVNFGVSLEQALTHLSDRVPLTDLRYFVVAVLIQRDSGGNLTEVLGNLSRLVRERAKLMAKVKVLSAEGRLSAWILAIMPFALAGLLNVMNPSFMSRLWTDPIGISMIKYLLVMMAMGVLVLRRIVRIRV
ncbi:type II secretion system F family protein [Caenimonas soli]|uniref:type II secretion system F family protein n=1 Tax=Caenimonas soli TaxID=2735555 RepID=UPI001552A514|nr:type II secretion system F family protein [Caenimonas soli]NPC55464.1 type II secretion system F family protein [Caenimonas soli]